MREITLARIDQDANEYRFYRLVLPTNSRVVFRQWGRINDYVNEKWDEYPDRESAIKAFERSEQNKRREGYINADHSVFPKNYMFYHAPAKALANPSGQLSLFDDD